MDLKVIGQKIKEARKMQGLTQEKLAELVGIHEKQLSKIETGKSFPTRKNLTKLFDILDIDFNDISCEKNIEKNISKEKIEAIKIINCATKKELKIYLDVLIALQKNFNKAK